MKKKNLMRYASALMALILILCPLSICFATDPTPTPTSPAIQQVNDLAKEVIYYYIWLYLRSVGINVEYGDIEEYTGAINDWIETELLEWLDTVPGIGTIDQLIFPWKFFWNPDGYLIGNQSFLDDIRDFTEYLIGIFDLDNNEVSQVESTSSYIGEMIVYSFPVIFSRDNGISNEFTVLTSQDDVYWTFTGNNSSVNPYAISLDGGTIHVKQFNSRTNEVYFQRNYNLISYNDWYYCSTYGMDVETYHLGSYPRYTTSQFFEYLDDNNTVTYYGNNIYIVTRTITPPSASDADGTNSIVITPSGNIYTPQDWDGTVHVDNLPAIVSTGTISNLDVSSVTLPFNSFINSMSDGLELMTDIIYNFPSPIVAFALAIISATIVFGVIKVLKEH